MADKDNKGIVLIVSLAVIVVLAVIVLEFNYITRVDLAIANNSQNETKAYYLAKSAVNAAVALLRKDEDFSYDCLDDDWAKEVPYISAFGGEVSLRTSDEESKININQINSNYSERAKQQIKRLLVLLGKDTTLVNKIIDEAPYKTIGQFSDDPELMRNFTVATAGKVNINTASPEVIKAISPLISHELAQHIVEFRKEHPFKDITQLSPTYQYKKPSGITPEIYDDIKNFITVRSRLFLVEAEAKTKEAVYKIDALIRRDGKFCEFAYWSEG